MKKLSKLNQRRLNNFKSNKRGYYSFWIFAFLFIMSVFADFLANEIMESRENRRENVIFSPTQNG